MLLSLYIENIAVIKRLEVEMGEGFTAMTGETGAGKSIILDSIKLLLGEKFDKELLRYGEESGCVTGLFGHLGEAAYQAFREADIHPDEEGCVLVQRVLSSDGKSRARINGQPVSLTVLRAVSKYLIDIHGQNENLTLMDDRSYTAILDGYAGDREELLAYSEVYNALSEVRRRLGEFDKNESERLRMIEMLRFQIADIEAVMPKPGEDLVLEEKERRIKNREKIARQTSLVYRALKGAERGSVTETLGKCVSAIDSLRGLLPETDVISRELSDCLYRIEDAAERVYDLSGEEEGDPTKLIDKIEERLDAISRLRKKYGDGIEEILAFRDDAKKRLSELDASDDTILALREEEKRLAGEAGRRADVLHALRASAAKKLEKKITEILLYLDMPKVVFRIPVKSTGKLARDGGDEVQFVMSANAGDIPRPLSAIASGGELARTFLALKCVLAEKSLTPTMIFDEIDAGVSGKTARKIGLKLLDLSRGTQVFCVTHSAQIASLADTHFLISKKERGGKTETAVAPLDREGRVGELSRILGGLEVTETQRNAALEMLDNREN